MFTYSMNEHYQGSAISDLYESRHGPVFCSSVKHLESSIEEVKNTLVSLVSPNTSFLLYRFLRALQQNRAQSRLLYLLSINRGLEPTQEYLQSEFETFLTETVCKVTQSRLLISLLTLTATTSLNSWISRVSHTWSKNNFDLLCIHG